MPDDPYIKGLERILSGRSRYVVRKSLALMRAPGPVGSWSILIEREIDGRALARIDIAGQAGFGGPIRRIVVGPYRPGSPLARIVGYCAERGAEIIEA